MSTKSESAEDLSESAEDLMVMNKSATAKPNDIRPNARRGTAIPAAIKI